jgi:acyl carrier protein
VAPRKLDPENGMSLAQVESTVKDVVSRCLHVDPAVLTGSTTWADVKADSLARIEITLVLEDTFKVAIPDEAAMGFKTLSDVVAHLHSSAEHAPGPT